MQMFEAKTHQDSKRRKLLHKREGLIICTRPLVLLGAGIVQLLEVLGIETTWGRDFSHPSNRAPRPNQILKQWVLKLSLGDKTAGAYRISVSSWHVKVKVKVKFSLEQATKTQKGEQSYSSTLPSSLDGRGWSTPSPGRFNLGKDTVPFVWEAGWAQGRSGRVRKTSPPPGFDPWNVQPISSRYTDWAIPAPLRGMLQVVFYFIPNILRISKSRSLGMRDMKRGWAKWEMPNTF